MKIDWDLVVVALLLALAMGKGCDSCAAESARDAYKGCVLGGYTAEECAPLMGVQK